MDMTIVFAGLMGGMVGGAIGLVIDHELEKRRLARGEAEAEEYEMTDMTWENDGHIPDIPEDSDGDLEERVRTQARYRDMAGEYSSYSEETVNPVAETVRIDDKEFFEIPEDSRQVCTWFKQDHILAGFDDDLLPLTVSRVLGNVEDALDGAQEDSLFFSDLDGERAYEVVIESDITYSEAYELNRAEQEVLLKASLTE